MTKTLAETLALLRGWKLSFDNQMKDVGYANYILREHPLWEVVSNLCGAICAITDQPLELSDTQCDAVIYSLCGWQTDETYRKELRELMRSAAKIKTAPPQPLQISDAQCDAIDDSIMALNENPQTELHDRQFVRDLIRKTIEETK